MTREENLQRFARWRYGLFIHYGLYSLLGRGEWALNREQIPLEEYRLLADRFTAEKFDADAICRLAVRAGMRYIVFTTMHHEGFCLYPSTLTTFHSRRDLVGEVVTAARRHGLGIGLYHSLNHWTSKPDAVDALEDPAARTVFIRNTHERIRELVTRYNPIDVLWYDGWWPFNADGWQAERMNAMARAIQPHILFNGRNGLPGDFATPEGHLGSPKPWRPWEACMTLNDSWGFHVADHGWKTPLQVLCLLATCAQGRGNLLLNIGPRGDGSVPEASATVLDQVGAWLRRGGEEAIFGAEAFTFDLQERGDHRGDWNSFGPCTVKGNTLYWLVHRWTGPMLTLGGLEGTALHVTIAATGQPVEFRQDGRRLLMTGLPDQPPDPLCTVIRIVCDRPPAIYQTGGLRIPSVPHPHYDPCPSDIQA